VHFNKVLLCQFIYIFLYIYIYSVHSDHYKVLLVVSKPKEVVARGGLSSAGVKVRCGNSSALESIPPSAAACCGAVPAPASWGSGR